MDRKIDPTRARVGRRARSEFRKAMLAVGLVAATLGADPAPAFRLGEPLILEPYHPAAATYAPAPKVEVVEPRPGTRLPVGRPIDCVVRLRIPEGGKLPSFVTVALKRGETSWGSVNATPQAVEADRVYTLAARLNPGGNPPRAEGPFVIEAEAVYAYMKKFRPYSSPVGDRTLRYRDTVAVTIESERLAIAGRDDERARGQGRTAR